MSLIQPVIDLLSNPTHWTTEVYARNSLGESVLTMHPDACCWCVMGAIKKIHESNNQSTIRCISLIQRSLKEMGELRGIAFYNDNMASHKDIIDLLNKAKETETSETTN